MNETPESDPRNKGPSSSPDDPTMASDSGGAKGEANIDGLLGKARSQVTAYLRISG